MLKFPTGGLPCSSRVIKLTGVMYGNIWVCEWNLGEDETYGKLQVQCLDTKNAHFLPFALVQPINKSHWCVDPIYSVDQRETLMNSSHYARRLPTFFILSTFLFAQRIKIISQALGLYGTTYISSLTPVSYSRLTCREASMSNFPQTKFQITCRTYSLEKWKKNSPTHIIWHVKSHIVHAVQTVHRIWMISVSYLGCSY